MTHFDTKSLGFNDLEGITYNPVNGTLYIVSTKGTDQYMGEVTLTGTLLQAYNLSLMGSAGNIRSDVALAPGSQNPGTNNIYIASRGVDNDSNRNENDGRIWEISLGGGGGGSPTPSRTPTLTSTPGPSPTPTNTPQVTDLIFADGFESADFSAWTANKTDVGDLSVGPAAVLKGTYGMQAVIDDTTTIFVTDDTPSAEPRYRARFYFDPNSISMASGDSHFIFIAYNGTSTALARIEFNMSAGQYFLRARILNDAGSWLNTAWFPISDAAAPGWKLTGALPRPRGPTTEASPSGSTACSGPISPMWTTTRAAWTGPGWGPSPAWMPARSAPITSMPSSPAARTTSDRKPNLLQP